MKQDKQKKSEHLCFLFKFQITQRKKGEHFFIKKNKKNPKLKTMEKTIDRETLKKMKIVALFNLAKELKIEIDDSIDDKEVADFIIQAMLPENFTSVFDGINAAKQEFVSSAIKMEKNLQDLDTWFKDIPQDFKEFFENEEKRAKRVVTNLQNKSSDILVLGNGSSGKSLFLNTIAFGEDILPTSALNSTSAITKIKYGDKRKMRARHSAKAQARKKEEEKKEKKKRGKDLGVV